MRYQGRITNWKDDNGFGFITAHGSGNQVFVHIKSFANRQRRPQENEIVTFELKTDGKGRAQAQTVAFVGERSPPVSSPGHSDASVIFAAVFLIVVAGSAFAKKLPAAIIGLYLVASAVAFIAYSLDKSAAKNDLSRTPESTLYFFALIGGWPGALVAQSLLRHKSGKRSFQIVFWATVVLNYGVLGWLFSPSGAEAIRSIISTA